MVVATSQWGRVICADSRHTHPYHYRYRAALWNQETDTADVVCQHNHQTAEAAVNCAARHCKRAGVSFTRVEEVE